MKEGPETYIAEPMETEWLSSKRSFEETIQSLYHETSQFMPELVFVDQKGDSSTMYKRASISVGAKNALIEDANELSPNKIIDCAVAYFDTDKDELLAPNRRQPTVQQRQIVMKLLRQHTDLSLPQIGSLVGDRHYATVIHGLKQADYLTRDPSADYFEAYQNISNQLSYGIRLYSIVVVEGILQLREVIDLPASTAYALGTEQVWALRNLPGAKLTEGEFFSFSLAAIDTMQRLAD